MTAEDMLSAGKLSQKESMNNAELNLVLMANELALAYLEGKGPEWALATNALRHERNALERCAEFRKRG